VGFLAVGALDGGAEGDGFFAELVAETVGGA
jgi:hypothetical protein